MKQTITTQHGTTHWRHKKLYGLILMFLLVGTLGMQAQKALWSNGFPKINPAPIIAYDTTYIEVAFAVNANSPATTVVFTLPSGITRTGAPIALSGNDSPSLTGTGTTITLGALTSASVVNFKVPIYANTCSFADGQKITVEVKSSGAVITDGTKELDALFQKPVFNGIFTPVEKNYTTKGEIQQLVYALSSINGSLNSTFRLTFTAPKTSKLTNFKLVGVELPANKILKTAINSGQDTIYTLVFDDKTWLNSTLPSTYGKITSASVNLTFDAETLTPCGTKTIKANGWYPSSNAASPGNIAPTTACGTIANSIFTIKMTDIAGIPNFNGALVAYSAGDPYTGCMDGVTPNLDCFVEYKNNGSADAYNTVVRMGCSGDMLSEYFDINNVYYEIEGASQKKVDPTLIRISGTSSVGNNWCDPLYAGKPLSIYVPIADPVPMGKKVKVIAAKIRGAFYNTSLATNIGRSILFNYLGSGIESTNECGTPGVNRGSDGDVSYTWRPGITTTSYPATSFRKSEEKTMFLNVYGGAMNSASYPMSIDVFVKLPAWLELEPTALLAGTALQWKPNETSATAANGTITNEGGGVYKLNLKTPQGSLISGYNILKVIYKATSNASYTENLNDSIAYWIDWNTFDPAGSATTCRPVFPKTGQIKQAVSLIVNETLVLDDFYPFRISRGLKDTAGDRYPDDGTLAPDNDIDHSWFMVTDTGNVVWKGHIGGTPTDTYNHIYGLFTSNQISFASNGAFYVLTTNPDTMFIKINGVKHPVNYVKVDNSKFYVEYSGTLKGGDQVEIVVPIACRAQYDTQMYMLGECYLANNIQTDPFNPTESERFGNDRKTFLLGSINIANHWGSSVTFNRNTNDYFNTSTSYSIYTTQYFPFTDYPKEVRQRMLPNTFTMEIPDGIDFNPTLDIKITQKPEGDVTRTLTPISSDNNVYVYDLKSLYDATYNGSQAIASGKLSIPDDAYFYFYPNANLRPTKGAAIGLNTIKCTLQYENLITGSMVDAGRNILINYTGTATTLTSSVSSIAVTTSKLNIPVLAVGNPGSAPINNVWLYVEGNVKNLKLTDNASQVTNGVGFEGRWLKAADQITDVDGLDVKQFAFDAEYTGGGNCNDEIRIYTVTAYDGTWTPDTQLALDKTDIDHSGALRRIPLTIPAASVGGSLAVTNLDGSVQAGFIAFEKNQRLSATINSHGASGALMEGKMTITVPAGQTYKTGTATIAYPSNAAPVAVDPDYETYLKNTININSGVNVDRTFVFDFAQASGNTSAMINGSGTVNEKEAVLTLDFIPGCATKLTGIRYEGTVSGKNACGQTATGDGRKVYSTGQYPKLNTNYGFGVVNTFPGRSAVGDLERTFTLETAITKTYGSNANIETTDSVQIQMHKAFNLVSATSSTYPGMIVGTNTVTGDTRTIRFSFDYASYNALADKGVNKVSNYTFNLTFDPSQYAASNGEEQAIVVAMVSNQVFDPSCTPQIATLANAESKAVVVLFDPTTQSVCPSGNIQPQISTATSSSIYTFNWSRDAAGTQSLGTGVDPQFTASSTPSSTETVYVDVVDASSQSLGKVRYQYSTYESVSVAVTNPAAICSGSGIELNSSSIVTATPALASLKFYSASTATAAEELSTTNISSLTTTTTYYVQATTTAGCKSTVEPITVTVNPIPSMTAPGNQTVNPGTVSAISLTGTGATYYTWTVSTSIGLSDESGTSATQIPSFTASNLTASAVIATITVTPHSATCAGTPVTFTITVNPAAVAGTFSNTSACSNTTHPACSATGGSTGITYYTWTGGSSVGLADYAGTDKLSIPSFTTATVATVTTATITVTPHAGAIAGSPTTFTITVNPAPTVTVSHNQPPTGACLNTDVIFTTQTGTDYVWTVDGATITAGATATSNTATLQWATAGTKTVTVNYKNSNGCQATTASQATISINTKPAVAPITLPAAVCEGTALTLPSPTVTAQGTPVTTQTWKLNNVAYTAGTALTYADNGKSLTFTASSACGDSIVTVGNITVNAKPTVAPITLPAAICEGSALTLPSTTVTARGTAVTAQTWKLAGTAYTAGTTLTYADNGKSLTFTASSACGDSIVTVGNITVNAKPTVAPITLPAAICEGSALTLPTLTVAARGTAITAQTWKLAGVAYTAGTLLTYADNGKSLTFTASSACGDSIVTVGNITVNAKPTVAPITLPAAICEGSALALPTPTVAARGTAITAQTWKLAGTAYTAGTVLTYADNGKSLTFTASSACGDSIVTVGNITVNAKPTVAPITLPAAICAGNALALPTPTVAARGTAITAQTWKLNGVAYTPGTNLAYSNNGKSLTFTASSACGDSVVTVGNITVYQTTAINTQPSVPAGIKLSNGYIIPGSIVPLSVAAVGHNLTYQWYWKKASDGSTVTLSDNSKYTGSTTASLTINNAYDTENGDYYVTVTGTCNAVTSTPVTIVAVANQDASLKDLKVNGTTLSDFNPGKTDYLLAISCDDEQVTILGTPNFAGVTSITGNGTFALQPGDNYFPITIVAQDMVTTRTYTVNVVRNCYVPKIKKDLDDAVICLNGTHTWTIEAEGENLTYEWYKGDTRIMGQNSPSITFTDAKFSDYDRYYVVVRSNHNGFKSSIQSKKVRLWVADYLPEHLRLAEYPNPATVGKNYHLKVDGYVDVTKYSWSYSKSGVTFSPAVTLYNDNETWATFGSLSVGTGTLKVTMEHPCGTRELTQTITVNYPTGVDDVTATVVTVYPNPTSGILKVSGTVANQMIRVTDVTGSLKGSYKTQEGITTIDLTGYAKGTYLVQYNGKAYKVIRK